MAEANTCEWYKGELNKDTPCRVCGKTYGKARHLWYNPTVFNGDAELMESFCLKNHLSDQTRAFNKLKEEIGPSDKERQFHNRMNREATISEQIERLEQAGYSVRKLNSIYQVRINNCLDLYPVSQSYHNIKANKRGMYNNMVGFVDSFFNH